MRKEVRFLLHIWCDSERDDSWRVRLEELATREIRLFADLDALHGYLKGEAKQRAGEDPVGIDRLP
jgi:hypothetical protein